MRTFEPVDIYGDPGSWHHVGVVDLALYTHPDKVLVHPSGVYPVSNIEFETVTDRQTVSFQTGTPVDDLHILRGRDHHKLTLHTDVGSALFDTATAAYTVSRGCYRYTLRLTPTQP